MKNKIIPSFKSVEKDYMKMVNEAMKDHPVVRFAAMENSLRRELGHVVQAALIAKTGNKMAGYTTLERIAGVSRTQARRVLHVELTGDLMLRTIVQVFDILGIPLKNAFADGIALKVREAGKK